MTEKDMMDGIRKAIRITLKYYMTYGEAKEYFSSIKKTYGKV